MKRIFLLVLLTLMVNAFLFSNDLENRNGFGLYLGVGFNSHNADFKRLPDCPSCSPGYKDGNGGGLNLGLVYDYPLYSKFLLSSKLLYKNLSGELINSEQTTLIVSGKPTTGEFEHSLQSTLGVIGLEPSVKYNLVNGLYLGLGLNVSYLFTKDYSQYEKIVKPTSSGTFLNPDGTDSHSRIRNEFSGTLQEANALFMAPVLSLSYNLPLNKDTTFSLEPELSYSLGLTNIVNDNLVNKWSVSTLSLGIALKYSPKETVPKPEKRIEEYKIDTIKIEKNVITSNFSIGIEKTKFDEDETVTELIIKKIITRTDTLFIKKNYKLDGSLIAVGVDNKGNEIENPTFVIEEFISNRLDPLLNYVFFDDNSSTLPNRYKRINKLEASSFNIENLFRDSTIELYYNILNIVGSRMKEFPNANITLTGCNSDLNNEKGNLKLSEERANTIKDYLVNRWNIEGNRIMIEKRNLPAKASTPKEEPDKIAENRRVEITSNNPNILKPIFIEKVDRTANPPIARFKTNISSDLPISSWELNAYQKSAPNQKFSRSGKDIENQIDWKLSENQKITPSLPELLISELKIVDELNNEKLIKGNDLKINIKTIKEKKTEMIDDYEIERFSLILFDFNKSNIEGDNKEIIEFIKKRIKPESEIEISGYADRTGNFDYNQKLAEQRAISARNSLNRKDTSAIGIGSSKLLYDNNNPEGRFYCRTVNIIVKTKIK